jgi:hypothetical protein
MGGYCKYRRENTFLIIVWSVYGYITALVYLQKNPAGSEETFAFMTG